MLVRGNEREKEDEPHIPLTPAKARVQSEIVGTFLLLDSRFRGNERITTTASIAGTTPAVTV